MERLNQLEIKTKEHDKKIEESYVREVQGNSIVEESKQKIEKAKTEVENCLKIVDDVVEDVKKQETEVK